MDFEFSDDQEQLRAAVRKWVERAYPFERRRAIAAGGGFAADAYQELAELGLCGLYVPQSMDGLGMGPVEAMVALEELGRGIVLEPLVQALIAGAIVSRHAPQALATQWAPAIASGEKVVVLAYLERAGRYRLDRCATTARHTAGNWTLSGSKSLVAVGDKADAFLVSAAHGGSQALFLVEGPAPGVQASGYGTVEGGRAAELLLQEAPAQLVSMEGLATLEQAVDIGIAATCARAIGVMDQTLAITVQYMNTRKQFGVAIGSFQAVRHRVADMKMQLELARSMSYYATLKLTAPTAERRAAMARAKLQLGQSMRYVGQQAIQLHGGIGMTDEYVVGHYFKCLTQMELEFGDSMFQLGEVSARMQDTAGIFA